MKSKVVSVIVALVAAGCSSARPRIHCGDDSQCTLAGRPGVCSSGTCAIHDPACPSGLRYDVKAGGSGACVEVAVAADMAAPAPPVDMALAMPADDMAAGAPADLAHWHPADMTIDCQHVGEPCSVGIGACQASGKITCATPGNATCDAVPGNPDSNWHASAAPNGSWDWNCDGKIEYQYPYGDVTTPASVDTAKCETRDSETLCDFHIWFTSGINTADVKGKEIDYYLCVWSSSTATCSYSGSTVSATEGIH